MELNEVRQFFLTSQEYFAKIAVSEADEQKNRYSSHVQNDSAITSNALSSIYSPANHSVDHSEALFSFDQ